MNRRTFIQSLAAVLSLPAKPVASLRSATPALPSATVVPAKARSWATYISALHGDCTPQTLQNLLHIPEVDAKKYIGQLIVEGIIKPNTLLQSSVSNLAKTKDDSLLEKVKHRLEMKTQAELEGMETCETAGITGRLDVEAMLPNDPLQHEEAEEESCEPNQVDFEC